MGLLLIAFEDDLIGELGGFYFDLLLLLVFEVSALIISLRESFLGAFLLVLAAVLLFKEVRIGLMALLLLLFERNPFDMAGAAFLANLCLDVFILVRTEEATELDLSLEVLLTGDLLGFFTLAFRSMGLDLAAKLVVDFFLAVADLMLSLSLAFRYARLFFSIAKHTNLQVNGRIVTE